MTLNPSASRKAAVVSRSVSSSSIKRSCRFIGYASGKISRNVLPCPGLLSTPTSPLWASMMALTIFNPRPAPCGATRLASFARKNFSKIRPRSSGGDADAPVPDSNLDPAVGPPELDGHGGPGSRIFQSIVDQVYQRLFHGLAIHPRLDGHVRPYDLQPLSPAFRSGTE